MKHYSRLMKRYVAGFVLSLAATLLAFGLVWMRPEGLSTSGVIGLLMTLALGQLLVQLVYFLHLSEEKKPRPHTLSFIFMSMVVLIIGLGSLWIMANLDYNMSPHEVETYIQNEELPHTTGEHSHHE